jgi:pimeloyl-ACP methyl ester carboxylesterase
MALRRIRDNVLLAIIGLLVLSLTGCVFGQSTVSSTPTPKVSGKNFAPITCQFAIQQNPITCGFFTVPENRANPQGHQIQIAVAVFKSPKSPSAPDPIIFLQGGPGGRLIQDLGPDLMPIFYPSGEASIGTTAFGNHDVIIVDQRGTGYSQPSLQCPEVVDLQYQPDQNLTVAQSTAEYDTALNQCHARLAAEGIDLSAYNTPNDAADIDDLIHALGYHQADLYGVSYGTRLALQFMRAFPQDTRSVVLDSTFPPQVNLWLSYGPNMAHVFGVLFHGCAVDPTCNASYPNLQNLLNTVLTRLNTHSITFNTIDYNTGQTYTVLFHGIDFATLLFSAFYATELIPYIPHLIYEVSQGQYNDLLSKFDGLLNFDDSVSWGVFYSVECAEDVPFMTPRTLATADQSFPAPVRAGNDYEQQDAFAECQRWGVTAAPASEKSPVVSSIPTLVLEGEYDPVTPPSQGYLAAQTLQNSYAFEFPAMGHGILIYQWTPCAMGIVRDFENAPNQKPDGSCTTRLPEPAFT